MNLTLWLYQPPLQLREESDICLANFCCWVVRMHANKRGVITTVNPHCSPGVAGWEVVVQSGWSSYLRRRLGIVQGGAVCRGIITSLWIDLRVMSAAPLTTETWPSFIDRPVAGCFFSGPRNEFPAGVNDASQFLIQLLLDHPPYCHIHLLPCAVVQELWCVLFMYAPLSSQFCPPPPLSYLPPSLSRQKGTQ